MRHQRHEHKKKIGILKSLSPLLGSIIAVVLIFIGMNVIDYLNQGIQSQLLSSITSFVVPTLPFIFVLFLIYNYIEFISENYPKAYVWIEPLVNAISLVVVVLALNWVLGILGGVFKSSLFSSATSFIDAHIFEIFVLAAVIGYALAILRKTILRS